MSTLTRTRPVGIWVDHCGFGVSTVDKSTGFSELDFISIRPIGPAFWDFHYFGEKLGAVTFCNIFSFSKYKHQLKELTPSRYMGEI